MDYLSPDMDMYAYPQSPPRQHAAAAAAAAVSAVAAASQDLFGDGQATYSLPEGIDIFASLDAPLPEEEDTPLDTPIFEEEDAPTLLTEPLFDTLLTEPLVEEDKDISLAGEEDEAPEPLFEEEREEEEEEDSHTLSSTEEARLVHGIKEMIRTKNRRVSAPRKMTPMERTLYCPTLNDAPVDELLSTHVNATTLASMHRSIPAFLTTRPRAQDVRLTVASRIKDDQTNGLFINDVGHLLEDNIPFNVTLHKVLGLPTDAQLYAGAGNVALSSASNKGENGALSSANNRGENKGTNGGSTSTLFNTSPPCVPDAPQWLDPTSTWQQAIQDDASARSPLTHGSELVALVLRDLNESGSVCAIVLFFHHTLSQQWLTHATKQGTLDNAFRASLASQDPTNDLSDEVIQDTAFVAPVPHMDLPTFFLRPWETRYDIGEIPIQHDNTQVLLFTAPTRNFYSVQYKPRTHGDKWPTEVNQSFERNPGRANRNTGRCYFFGYVREYLGEHTGFYASSSSTRHVFSVRLARFVRNSTRLFGMGDTRFLTIGTSSSSSSSIAAAAAAAAAAASLGRISVGGTSSRLLNAHVFGVMDPDNIRAWQLKHGARPWSPANLSNEDAGLIRRTWVVLIHHLWCTLSGKWARDFNARVTASAQNTPLLETLLKIISATLTCSTPRAFYDYAGTMGVTPLLLKRSGRATKSAQPTRPRATNALKRKRLAKRNTARAIKRKGLTQPAPFSSPRVHMHHV